MCSFERAIEHNLFASGKRNTQLILSVANILSCAAKCCWIYRFKIRPRCARSTAIFASLHFWSIHATVVVPIATATIFSELGASRKSLERIERFLSFHLLRTNNLHPIIRIIGDFFFLRSILCGTNENQWMLCNFLHFINRNQLQCGIKRQFLWYSCGTAWLWYCNLAYSNRRQPRRQQVFSQPHHIFTELMVLMKCKQRRSSMGCCTMQYGWESVILPNLRFGVLRVK